jgi:type II secretion system protein D
MHPLLHRSCFHGLYPAVTVVCMIASPSSVKAQSSPQPGVQSAVSIRLSGQVPLARVVDLASERMGVRIEYDASALTGAVTVRGDSGLSPQELWDFMNLTLASRGFATIRTPGSETLSVVKLADAAALARAEVASEDPARVRAGFVSEIVRVEGRSAKDAADSLRPFLSKQGGSASPLGASGLLVISDTVARVDQAKELLRTMSDMPQVREFAEVEVKNLTAEQVIALATQLTTKQRAIDGREIAGELIAGPSGTSIYLICPPDTETYWRSLITRLDQQEPATTQAYTPRSFAIEDVARLIEQTAKPRKGNDERFQVVEDDLTGTLLVTATPTQHAKIEALMQRLDAQQSGARPVRTFAVRNRPVQELVSVLERLISVGALDGGSGDGATSARAEETFAAGSQQSAGPSRTATTGTGVATGVSARDGDASTQPTEEAGESRRGGDRESSRGSDAAISLTADEGTNSIIAIGEPRALAQLETLISTLDVRQPQVMLEATLISLSESDSVSLGVELERLFRDGETSYRLSSLFGLSGGQAGNRTVGDGGGFTGAVLNPGDFAAVVRAVQNISEGRSVSAPKVLVNNNEQATFGSVLQQPVGVVSQGNSSTQAGFGGTQDAGTTISVRPQIAEGDHLVLQYSVSLSSFVGTSPAANLPPPRQQNQVNSVATIPDGHAVVVGGLELITDGESAAQIPGLGAIPLLGNLFKNQTKNAGRQRFFVFIRAEVLRNERLDDLRYLSDVERSAFPELVDDDTPRVEPRVIR